MTPLPATPEIPAGTPDPRLASWLAAPVGPEADRLLARLLAEEAAPVFEAIMRRKLGAPHQGPDAEDVISEARLQVVSRLQRLRDGRAEPGELPPHNFRAYVATVTYTAWAGHLRRRHPGRAMLYNRVRYLLEGRVGPKGFALWRGECGELLAGFAAWRDEDRRAQPTPRERWLLVDARAAATDAFGAANDVPDDLPTLLAGLFSWLDRPLELRELVRALVELLNAGSAAETTLDAVDEGELALPDLAPTPAESLRWKEYLHWLWQAASALPLRQRTAFLLHGSLLRELELVGLTSVRAAASVLELAPERLAELWALLPLDDLRIAGMLGGSRQQVINLRKVARATLGDAWRKWLGE